jgi:hypothetical protein
LQKCTIPKREFIDILVIRKKDEELKKLSFDKTQTRFGSAFTSMRKKRNLYMLMNTLRR